MESSKTKSPFLDGHPFLRYFLPLTTIAVVVITLGSLLSIRLQTRDAIDSLRSTQLDLMDTLQRDTIEPLATAAGDLTFLIQQDAFLDLPDGTIMPETEATERIERLFLQLAITRGQYEQIRFIGTDGNELVRVNLEGDVMIPIDFLQFKGDQYYFENSINLEPGHIYVSPLDLNTEHGRVEEPYKPVLRLATPVADRSGRVRGIVILNYLGSTIIEAMRADAAAISDSYYLINEDGYWMIHPDADQEWAFMFDHTDARLSADLPAEWARMLEQPSGQFETDGGLFTHRMILPLQAVEAQAKIASTDAGKSLAWVSYSLIKPDTISQLRQSVAREATVNGLLILAGAVSLSAIAALALSRQWANRFQLREAAFVFRAAGEGIMITGADNRIHRVNKAFTEITGYEEDEVLDEDPSILQSGQHDEAFYQAMWQTLSETGRWKGEIWDRRKDGAVYPQRLSISAITDERGQINRFVGVFSDITKEIEEAKALEYLATHDPLTGLSNRSAATAQLEVAVSHSRRHGDRVAVLFMDLDGFKPVNDTYGHAAGDTLLQVIAGRLRTEVRASDTVARIGGDEFVLILTGAGNDEHIDAIARRVLDSISTPITIDDVEVRVAGSIGIAATSEGTPEEGETLLREADLAMYTAKKAGGGGLVWAGRESLDQ